MKPKKRSFPRLVRDVPVKKIRLTENLWIFDASAANYLVDYDVLYSPMLNDMKNSKSPESLCAKIAEASTSWEIVQLFVGRQVYEEIEATTFGLRLKKIAEELQHKHRTNFKDACTKIRTKFPKYKDGAADLSDFQIKQSQIEQALYQIFGDLLQPVWGAFCTKKDSHVLVRKIASALFEWRDDSFMNDRYYEEVPLIWDEIAKVANETGLDDENRRNYLSIASATAINITRFAVLYSLHILRKLTCLVFAGGNPMFVEKSASKLAKESEKFPHMFTNSLAVKIEASTSHSETMRRVHVPDEKIVSQSQLMIGGEPSTSIQKPALVKVTQRIVTKVIDEVSVSSDDEVSSPKTGPAVNKPSELNKSFDAAKVKKEVVNLNNETGVPGFNRILNVKQEFGPSPSANVNAQHPDVISTASSAENLANMYPEFSALDLDSMDEEMKKQILVDQSLPTTTKGLIITLMDTKKDLKSKYNQLLERYTNLRSRFV